MIKTVCFIIIIIMTIMGSVAALFLKKASGSKSIKSMLFNRNLYFGAGLYVAAALLNIYVLKFLDYSVVLPLTSITYIWTLIISYVVLKEKIGMKKIIGVIGILIGAVFVALSR